MSEEALIFKKIFLSSSSSTVLEYATFCVKVETNKNRSLFFLVYA